MSYELPTQFEGTLVGRKPAGSFVRNGETIQFAEKLQFLTQTPEGSAQVIEIPVTALDQARQHGATKINPGSLNEGDRIRAVGVAVLPERNERGQDGQLRQGYPRFTEFEAVEAKPAVRAA